MNKSVATTETGRPEAAGSMLSSYTEIARALVPGLVGTALLDEALAVRGQTGAVRGAVIADWLRHTPAFEKADHLAKRLHSGHSILVIPIRGRNGTLGTFCTEIADTGAGPENSPAATAKQLQPVIESLRRELAGMRRPARNNRDTTLTQRTQELEWLFKLTQNLQGANEDSRVLEQLLSAATVRMRAAFGALAMPEKQIFIHRASDAAAAASLGEVFEKNRGELLGWVQRRNRALVVNGTKKAGKPVPCKILCVPIVLSTDRVIGMMAFLNPRRYPSFEDRHVYLARHLGRQAASLIEAQFDLMTGLYSRSGLEQAYLRALSQSPDEPRSVIYVDIDRTHVVNELHGFELGNELIVRVAGLLSSPTLPEGAISARISGDRFAVVLRGCDAMAAAEHASRLREDVTRIAFGQDAGLGVSISCGIADLLDLPQGLARALAAAEIACKAAKDHGRDRVEVYRIQDSSIMRRRDDVAEVGRLRHALRANSLKLYAQRIAPLQRPELPGGYEILLRLKEPDGSLTSPGPTIAAAQRYQLLPSIDRWVTQRALECLAPYQAMLKSSGIYMAVNISGQSLGDEAFAQEFLSRLRDAALPHGTLCVEITEQAAVTNMARAGKLLETLKASGCRIAIDDFGTGANTLSSLKDLQAGCLKIDGVFVRDMLTNPRSRATVRSIVELAKACQMTTVAEFVESQQLADELRKMGVDFAQGYALGRPQPLEDLLAVLGRDESARLHRLFLES